MTTNGAARGQVAASAAEVYEEFFVPALFEQWAEPVLDAAGVAVGDVLLDVGCGTGVVARAAARRVGPAGEVTGLDRNAGMLPSPSVRLSRSCGDRDAPPDVAHERRAAARGSRVGSAVRAAGRSDVATRRSRRARR